jgi:HD superfamily phosphohydrolase
VSFALRDPIHDYIRVDDLEAAVLQSRPLQRLRFVRQLGLANLVFPGAEHSRFGHVLGAMKLAGRVYDALAEKTPDVLENHPQAMDRRRVRLAALLHDIGHAPFSHSAEELFEGGIEHEQMTTRLLQLPELTSLLDVELGTESIAGILSGRGASTERLLSQIVSGDLDADKMDYLLRDSHYCGVRYGNYDLGRLLETIEPLQDPETGTWGIGIDEGGVHAFEALVLARYYMFSQVYFNVTGKVLELHLNEWLARSEVRWPADPLEFLEHDDHSVWWRMRQSDDPHARAILDRDHYFLAFETKEHLNETERRAFTALLDELRSWVGENELLVSNSAKDPHRLDEAGILVRGAGGELRPMQHVSHFIRHLTRIDRFRVYVHKDRCSDVGQLFRERWS